MLIKQRLEQFGLEQRDLAAAATVTDSYISQLFTRKKLPHAPDRTAIHDKMPKFLKLPAGKLSEMADLQRKEELKRNLREPPPCCKRRPTPLYYQRAFQNLRDPLHFRSPLPVGPRAGVSSESKSERSVAPMPKHMEAKSVEKQPQFDGRKKAMEHRAENKRSPGKKPKAESP
jgi:transcriptional regulator with XRE-family HTH domain